MYKKRRYKKQKRKQKGKGFLLGLDWPEIRKNLQPYLRKRKQLGKGTWWGYGNSIFY